MTIAMTTETSTTSNTQSANSQNVSSSYLVMLNRYIKLLKAQQESLKDQEEPLQLPEPVDYAISIDEVSASLDYIERLTGYAYFGLEIGQNMHPSDYGIFGYAMMNCENLLCALKTASEHKTILNQKLFAEFIYDKDDILYQINTDLNSKQAHILIELDFSTALEFAKRLAGPNIESSIQLTSVHFTHAPLGPIDKYLERFQCPVYFNEPFNRIRVAKKELETPIYGANPKVLSVLEDKIIQIASHQKYQGALTLIQKVEFYIRKNMHRQLPTAQEAAKHFNMSLSSFKKNLATEKTSYQRISDEIRYRRCMELMKKDNMAIKEIALSLGFAGASAFNKAFKRWSGCSPSEFRAEQLDQESKRGLFSL